MGKDELKDDGRVPDGTGLSSSTEPQSSQGLGPTGFDPSRVKEAILELSNLEITLLLGKADRWGSWMFDAAMHMVRLGLGREDHGSIAFDTPLAKAVIAELLCDSDGSRNGRDREDGLDGEAARARAEGIAHTPPEEPQP